MMAKCFKGAARNFDVIKEGNVWPSGWNRWMYKEQLYALSGTSKNLANTDIQLNNTLQLSQVDRK